MNPIINGGARFAAAAALLCAVAVAPAGATDWGSLNATWNGGDSDSSGLATSDVTDGKAHYGVDIANAFESLGMSANRAECYGKVLVSKLTKGEQKQAADIVRTASNGEEVRALVLDSEPNIVGGFTAANESCPEAM